ncbi:MAG TPA: iron-sulfur cluster assembly protein [Miltoncostaeaceae bacterium]|nr:iron-sulfur cluster assembly protein [Miltoncostaeaceae bacterium]
MTPTLDAARDALDRVIDPELDRSLVALDFVQSLEVEGGLIRAAVRLPTYWCSPNFAYLMVGDAHEALRGLPGATAVSVQLVDHCEGERITEAVASGLSFQEAFPTQADGELGELRRRFRLKAFVVRQEPVLRAARQAIGDEAAVALRLGDGSPPAWADPGEWAEYLARRRDLAMGGDPGALAFTDSQGDPLAADGLADYVRLARSVRISLESNTEFCTGLLAARYGDGLEEWRTKEVAA